MTITLDFPGYKIDQNLYEGVKTLIYKGHRQADSAPVAIKTLRAEYPTLEEITRLRHEYQILHALNIDGIIKTYELLSVQNRLALILEGFESISLKHLISSHSLSILQFLDIAIALTHTLGELHQNQVIHKDIKPHNVLINPENYQTKLIDFSIATRLEQETQNWNTPNQLEGTLAYMSPEQTGRMNRSLDYRSDFYSLGVTFYEMLTGQLPFFSHDPMEIIHCHIAKTPISPHKIDSKIPAPLSALVMKLMSKTAEKRYQSARGIQSDLEECRRQWQKTGKIENFTPGKLDELGQFLIPQNLYGREAEVITLLESFDRVSAGETEMMLVSGYSGVGKTRVVQEVHKPIVRQRGYFIAGKFDQFQRDIPYAALIQAFQDLTRQVLTENNQKITDWKKQILEAVGQNGRVITEVIPEVELIIGRQPEVTQLGASESQNRFNRVFKQFINVFTKKEHPLVVFLDDLQWADISSLKLIQLLITDPDSQYFLFIGAYRDNEVSPTHPAILTIDEIEKAGATVYNIVLAPLKLNHVSELVADTLQERKKSQVLAELLFNKTQGNPFFLTQLLKTLHEDNLVNFDFDRGVWSWDIDRIQSFGITDLGVVELVARNIQKLPESTQKVLKLAACIGNRFYLDVLSIVHEKSSIETSRDFWASLQAGLILPLSKDYKIPLAFNEEQAQSLTWDETRISYRFLHDRVQQAAYSLIPDDEKKSTHLKIGQLLLKQTKKVDLEENVFDIVNQLNIGLEFIEKESEKEELIRLNAIAGKKAKASTAYEAAIKYFKIGIDLLPESYWEQDYDFMKELYTDATEVNYLVSDFEQADKLSEIVLSRAHTLFDKIKLYELKIGFYFSQNRLIESLDLGLQILSLLGVKLPQKPKNLNVMLGLVKLKFNLSRSPKDLTALSVMSDPYKLAAIRIMINLTPITFTVNPALFPVMVFKMVNLCLKHGNSPLSAYIFGAYSIIASSVLGDIESGYKFGNLSLTLLNRFNAEDLKAKIYMMFNTFIRFSKEHIKNTQEPFLEAIQSGLANGDIPYATQCAYNSSFQLLFTGEHLETVIKNQEKYLLMMQAYKEEFLGTMLQIWTQFIRNLLSNEYDEPPVRLIGKNFHEEQFLSIFMETSNFTGVMYLKVAKLILSYLFKNHSQSVDIARSTEQYQQSLMGTFIIPNYNFYYSLALLAHYFHIVDRKEKKQYLKKITANQKQMKKWAHHAPMNFQHKYDLVEAETARVLGDSQKASLLYDRAIAGAKTNQFTHEEAIANELAAEFYQAQGRTNIAKTYMTEAYYGYIRWGAKAKVKDLDDRHPELIIRTIRAAMGTESPITTTTTSITSTHSTATSTHTTTGFASRVLDLNTVFKASLALSGELVIEKLLEKLLKISIENAGANMGMFLSKQDEQWIIEAIGRVNPAQQQDETTVNVDVAVSSGQTLPLSLLNYVEQTKENLVLDNASTDGLFSKDSYVQEQQPKSVLCAPLIHQNKLTGLLYLENNEISGAFTQERLKVINLLASQISISVDNARLYTQLEEYSRTLESKVEQRTQQLREKNGQLEDTLQELKLAQRQIVAQEKLASLGSLTAGIAHEIRNPLNFVNSLANLSQDLTQDIVEEIERQTEQLDSETVEFLSESLDYLKRNVSEIHQQGKRADSIITSMLMHARTGSSSHQPGELNFVVAEAVQLAHQSLRAKDAAFNIEFDTQYDDSIGEIVIAAADLGRAIINIVDNACYAARKKSLAHADETFVPTVQVITRNRDTEVEIFVRDNGNGIPAEIKEKIFNPFFTTKPTGEGTGLGLSICHDIIVGQHRGEIQVNTRPGEGTDITIVIPRQLPETEGSETELQEDVKPQVPYFKSENQTPYFKD